uniref:ARF7 effector protein C-terminal domain-containing protein n=1 Tax=Glossina palpalis gambiensis TaxID=67801 RepID=A0A1B0BB16_9MUSC
MENKQNPERNGKRGRGRPRKPKKELEWDRSLDLDACDCNGTDCPGCWFPCDNCGSTKCSPFCRLFRGFNTLHWHLSN